MARNNKYYNNKSKDRNRDDRGSNTKGNDNARRDRDKRTPIVENKRSYINNSFGTENDPGWYNRLPALFEQATKVSFFNQVGAEVDLGSSRQYRIPGALVLDMVTGPGTCELSTDPVNMTAVGMYESIRKELNKAITEYEAQDLMIMMICADDIYSQYAYMLRLIGIMNTYDSINLYKQPGLVAGMLGLTPRATYTFVKDFINGQANYLLRFNNLVDKANKFLFVPADFTIFKRHAWLFSSIFTDSPDPKAQLYIHNKANFWLWDEAKYDTGSCASYNNYARGKTTFGELLDVFQDCIEKMRNSSSVRAMIADMRQAFQDKNFFEMAIVEPNYRPEILYSAEVLSQIENAESIGSLQSGDLQYWKGLDVTQDPNTNVVLWQPHAELESGVVQQWSDKHLVNMHKADPDQNDFMVATRNKVSTRVETETLPEGGTKQYVYVNSATPDFFTTGVYVCNPNYGVAGDLVNFYQCDPNQDTLRYFHSNAFDWHPFLYTSEPTTPPVGDYDNYTVVDSNQLQQMDLVALLSLWGVPESGHFQF